jgi:hypothetical protein
LPAAVNRLFENRWIAGNSAQAVLLDQPFQLTAENEVAPDLIEPDRLVMFSQLQ